MFQRFLKIKQTIIRVLSNSRHFFRRHLRVFLILTMLILAGWAIYERFYVWLWFGWEDLKARIWVFAMDQPMDYFNILLDLVIILSVLSLALLIFNPQFPTSNDKAEWKSFLRNVRSSKNNIYMSLKDKSGFFGYTDAKGEHHRSKTIWDWLGLLIVPLVLTLGALLFDHSEQIRAREIELDRFREETINTYFNDMESFLLDKNLLSAKDDLESSVLIVAQVKTIKALRSLDKERRDNIFQFIRDADLTGYLLIGASLENINLRGNDLSDLNFSEAYLAGADLRESSLYKTNLSNAILRNANLSNTICEKTNFEDADLGGANFTEADIIQTNFNMADLDFAILKRARLYKTDLSNANLLDLSIMPDGREYDPSVHTFEITPPVDEGIGEQNEEDQ